MTPKSNTPNKPELFTLQVQGKGVQIKARVPGWVVAAVFRFVKEHEKGAAWPPDLLGSLKAE